MPYKGRSLIIFCFFLFSYIFFPFPTFANNVPDQSHSSLSVSSSVPADGQTTAIVTVTLHDGSGNPIVGDSVTLSDSSNSGATITVMLDTTDVSGHALFSIKSTKAQTDNLDLTDTTTNVKFYNLGKITFTAAGCYDSPPGSTPQLISATANGSSQIVLTWTIATNPVTNYLVSYGLASGQYIYGNPNVGGQGTTSYTVGSLSPGKKYYFVVQAVNGCTPGSFSNEVSTTAGGIVIPTIDTSSKTNSQTNIVPTNIPDQNNITPTDIPTPSQNIQPTTVAIPIPTSNTDNPKTRMLLFVSIGVWMIGSIGNVLYWKHKKNELESVKMIEENQ